MNKKLPKIPEKQEVEISDYMKRKMERIALDALRKMVAMIQKETKENK